MANRMALKPVMAAPENLENLIAEVTSPINSHLDLHTFKKIYESINNDSTGPEKAIKLLAHKIQSPHEKEAIAALVILDLCVQNCGVRLQLEIGKFKFLNEMIKVLSPKYLGETTPPSVKQKCINLLFTWQRDLNEACPKIGEAYQMLKSQGVIAEDPVICMEPYVSTEQINEAASRNDIFKSSPHASTLAKLLKSRNPDDLRQANAIIKNIVNEEEVRVEKQSRRAMELETLRNNSKLLDEMLKHLGPGEPSTSDGEIMEVIAGNIKKSRPLIFKLALTDEDREEGFLADVIDTCSRASSILEQYEVAVLHKTPSTISDPASPGSSGNSGSSVTQAAPGSSALVQPEPDLLLSDEPKGDHNPLSHDLLLLELDNNNGQSGPEILQRSFSATCITDFPVMNDDFLNDLLCSSPANRRSLQADPENPSLLPTTAASPFGQPTAVSPVNAATPVLVAALPNNAVSCVNYNLDSSPEKNSNSSKTEIKTSFSSSSVKMFGDLDLVGRQLLGFSSSPHKTSTCSLDSLKLQTAEKKQTQNKKSVDSVPSALDKSISNQSTSLATLPDLPLSSIQAHPRYNRPLTVFEDALHLLTVDLHYTGNEPASGIRVFVAVVTSRSPLPVSQLSLRFGVDKPLKLRQLPASLTSLPAFCSFLPPSPSQQVIFIQNTTSQISVSLKFQLSFTVDDEDVLESGKAEVSLD